MPEIRELQKEDIETYGELLMHAYTGGGISTDRRQRLKEFIGPMAGAAHQQLYGAFTGETLVGGMRLIDYRLKLGAARLPTGGIAAVAVDLLHKQEGVASELIAFACDVFRRRGTAIAALHPFRIDYYKKMGFGYGSQLRRYKVEPRYFPDGPRDHLAYLTPDDWLAIIDCHAEYMESQNALFELSPDDFDQLFAKDRKLVGCWFDGRLMGYLSFGYHKLHYYQNHLVVHDLVYTCPAALRELLAFLRSQGDQFERVVIFTPDESLHYLIANPASGEYAAFDSFHIEFCVSGIAVQFRVLDTAAVFRQLADHSFGGTNLRLKLTVRDEFLPANDGSVVIHFRDGRPEVVPDGMWDVEVGLGVADFSSLLLGAVDFATLCGYGLATVSDAAAVGAVDALFRTGRKPACTTGF